MPDHVRKRLSDARRRLAKSQRGKKRDPSIGRKVSASKMGHSVSETTRRKLSDALAGKPAPHMAGPNNPQWKGGASHERSSGKMIAWSKAVKRRDEYTCQKCGHQSRRGMHAHHIKSFAEHKELRYELSNGETLCKPCHSNAHGNQLAILSVGAAASNQTNLTLLTSVLPSS